MANKSSADLKAQFADTDPADQNTDLVDSLGTTVDASATVKGKVELATSAETITGTDDARAVTPAGLAALTASATRSGLVELATDAEAITGADTARAVTPANLAAAATTHVAAASATVAGKVELATDAEAKTGTDTARAVTAANVRAVLTGLKTISFPGKNGAGAISAVGAVVGDKVIDAFGLTSGALGSVDTLYETTITVNDQIQQVSQSDLSTYIYVALLLAVA